MDLMTLIMGLAILTLLFWLGYHVTGALLSAVIWLFIKIPFAIVVGCMGVVFCATILLFPLGRACFHGAAKIAV